MNVWKEAEHFEILLNFLPQNVNVCDTHLNRREVVMQVLGLITLLKIMVCTAAIQKDCYNLFWVYFRVLVMWLDQNNLRAYNYIKANFVYKQLNQNTFNLCIVAIFF